MPSAKPRDQGDDQQRGRLDEDIPALAMNDGDKVLAWRAARQIMWKGTERFRKGGRWRWLSDRAPPDSLATE